MEGFEKPNEPERDVEQDRAAFVEGVHNSEIAEIETDFYETHAATVPKDI